MRRVLQDLGIRTVARTVVLLALLLFAAGCDLAAVSDGLPAAGGDDTAAGDQEGDRATPSGSDGGSSRSGTTDGGSSQADAADATDAGSQADAADAADGSSQAAADAADAGAPSGAADGGSPRSGAAGAPDAPGGGGAEPPAPIPATAAGPQQPASGPTAGDRPAPAGAHEPAGTVPVGAGTPLWSDEFSGSTLDRSVWTPYHSTYGDGNRELQCHTPNNVKVSNGTLKLVARRGPVTCPNGDVRRFSSGFLGTRETGTYFPRFGRFEMRAKLPHGQGLWPAFWLRHRDGSSTAEVDVMEYFHSQVPGKTTSTVHLDGRANVSKRSTDFERPTDTPRWHTWSVEIEPVANGAVQFSFAVDGTVHHRYVDRTHRWADSHRGKNLFDIAVNLSVGGNWAGDPDRALGYLDLLDICAQGGSAPSSCDRDGVRRATFPSVYEIDYVRVYAHR